LFPYTTLFRSPDNPWWVGQVAMKVTVPNQAVYEQYFSGPQLQNLNWGAWNTVSIPVGQTVKDSFMGSSTGAVRAILNIGCAGQGSTQFLIDNVRFGGNTSFRPGCEPGGTTGGSGGSGGAGGSAGTGGTSGAGGVGGVGGSAGTAGSGTGGTGGTGGSGGFGGLGGFGGSDGSPGAVGQAAEIFSFESPSYWSPTYPQETTLVTHLDAALRTSPWTWTELNSVAFDTDEVPSGQYLHLDVYVPAPSGSWGGAVRPIFVCPS